MCCTSRSLVVQSFTSRARRSSALLTTQKDEAPREKVAVYTKAQGRPKYYDLESSGQDARLVDHDGRNFFGTTNECRCPFGHLDSKGDTDRCRRGLFE
jgi:hypothetical protein